MRDGRARSLLPAVLLVVAACAALPTQHTPPAAEHTGEALAGTPLAFGLGRGDAVTSAHVIEAVLNHAPAVRREVERLCRRAPTRGRSL